MAAGRNRHHGRSGPCFSYMLPVLGGRRRRRGGTRVAEADRRPARGRCAGRISWVGPGTGQPPRSGATALGRAGLRRVEGNTVFGMFLYNLNCNIPCMH